MKENFDAPIKPDLIVFDWDHTLVEAPINVTGRDIDATLDYYRRSMPEDVVATFPRSEMVFSLPITIFEHEHEPCMEWFKIPGSQVTLDYFAAHGVPLAIVSNKANHILRLEAQLLKWNRYFKVIIGRGDAPRPKPAPDLLFLAASRCNLQPGNKVWFVGDSRVDTQAANAAGFVSIHYRYRADDKLNSAIYKEYMHKYENVHPIGDGEPGACHVIDSLNELIYLYKKAMHDDESSAQVIVRRDG